MAKYIPLNLDPDMVAQIDALARKEDRSRAGMIRQLLKRGLDIHSDSPHSLHGNTSGLQRQEASACAS